MNKVTTLPKRTRVRPEDEPMAREDFEESCVVDELDGVVGQDVWQRAMEDGADSHWSLL